MGMLVTGIGNSGNEQKQTTVNHDCHGGAGIQLSVGAVGSRELPFTL